MHMQPGAGGRGWVSQGGRKFSFLNCSSGFLGEAEQQWFQHSAEQVCTCCSLGFWKHWACTQAILLIITVSNKEK